MYPIKLERDTTIVEWQSYLAWSNVFSLALNADWSVKSDGVVKTDYGVADARDVTGVITARSVSCVGVHLTGPQTLEHTCYQISAVAGCEDATVKPVLLVGESDLITSHTDGNLVDQIRILAYGDFSGSTGSRLDKQLTIAVPLNPQNKGICFAIGMMSGASASSDFNAWAHLSVRRLIGASPTIIDTTKL